MKPDYWRIHWLEYKLGLRGDPPPMRPAPVTDKPGAVIYYDPKQGRTEYTAQ